MNRIISSRLWYSLVIYCLFLLANSNEKGVKPAEFNRLEPNQWMLMQRLYPYGKINPEAYEQSRKQAIQFRQQAALFKSDQEEWQSVGPYNVGGRVTDVEMHSSDTETIYACAASGGIYKSTDKGISWNQIFENEFTLSIGDMAIAETDKNILFVGTGEPNGGGGSVTYDGYGVFKSIDGGATWTHKGLENAGGIGRVEVDPTNADRVFVAAMGNLFTNNPQRGVFRTVDGGQNWENVLHVSDSTGAIDLCINPQNPDIIFAGMWERVRGPYHRTYSGYTTGLYRSTNGGDTWEHLTTGLPSGNVGRIGIDISKSNPANLYTTYSKSSGGFEDVYKTTNGGDNWTDLNSGIGGSLYSWWFGKVQIHPTDPDVVWVEDLYLNLSVDGGITWQKVGGLHVDQHALYVHPVKTNFTVTGNDGGVYVSSNAGQQNTFVTTLPITQFYTCEVNYQNPVQRYGGTQDNGINRTLTGESDDWSQMMGADGMIVRVDPTDDRYIYASLQYNSFSRSTEGGKPGSFILAQPNRTDRYNWKTPYILDPNDPKTLYIGSHKVYKSTDRAESWTQISDDLTKGDPGLWHYATLTTLAVSPLNGDIIYAGSDDGNVWVNTDGGASGHWTKISADLPVRWVTSLATDPFAENTAYVGFSGLRYHDYEPHIFKTTDLGMTWEDISGNLPDIPINQITVDPGIWGTLYLATDNGVYVTYDSGDHWEMLGNGLPTVPVTDLNLHSPTRTLLAATYGRSQYLIHLREASGTSAVKQVDENMRVFPNPSPNQVTIQFELQTDQKGKLIIYNLQGQVVEVIKNGVFMMGTHSYIWNGSQHRTSTVSGTFICRLVTDKEILAARITIDL